MATQQVSFSDFQKRIKPGMLDANGRFKGPDSGVNHYLEGMTPEEAYTAATVIPDTPKAFDDVRQNTPLASDGGRSMYLDPAWRPGEDVGGGIAGGLGRGFQGMLDGVTSNPALMAAATAGLASYAGVSGFTGAGETAGEFAGMGTSPGWSAAMDSQAANLGFGSAQAAIDAGVMAPSGGLIPAAGSAGAAAVANGTAPAGGLGSGTFNLEGSIPDTTSSVIQGPGTGLSTGTYGPPTGGAATTAAGTMIGDGTAVAGAQAMANSGSSMVEIAKKYGPQIAKMVMAAGASAIANDGGATGGGVNANVDSMISSALGNTKSMENDYNTLFKPWAIDQVGKATTRGDAGYDALTGLASAPNKNLAAYQTYVDRVGSQGYRDQQRGQAMGEVQQQSDIALGGARRAAMARGVDPSKFALQANANSINTAAAKTKAAADAEGLAWDQYGKGAQTAAGMHIADTSNRANLTIGANNLGAQGLNAGTKLATVDGAYRGGLSGQYNSTLGAVTGATNSANNQSNYEREHGLSGVINAGLATAATKWMTDKGGDAIGNFFSS